MKHSFICFSLCLLMAIGFSSCSDKNSPDSATGSVTVTALKGSSSGSSYEYKITVKYSGSSSDVKSIGCNYGDNASTTSNKHHTGAQKNLVFTVKQRKGSRLYYQGYVNLKNGKKLTSSKGNTLIPSK